MTKSKTQKPKGRPFKKLYCDRDDIFLLPPLALKLWLFYYRLEGVKREGWASRQTICEKCGMDKDAVTFWRRWLVKYNWLRQVGERKTPNNPLATIPVMQVTRGTVPDRVERRGKSKSSKANLNPKRRRDSQSPSGGGKSSHRAETEKSVTPVTEVSVTPVTGFSGGAVTETFSPDVDVRTEVDKSIDKTYVDGPVKGPVQGFSSGQKSDSPAYARAKELINQGGAR